VSTTLDVPLWGIILSSAVDCLLGLIYFGSTAAFNSFTGVATICLSTSYGIPILISIVRGRRAVRNSPFSLGKFGYAINIAAVSWIALAVALFCMPVSLPVDPSTMNYASVVFAGFASISVAWYFIRARKAFTGPPVVRDDEDDEGGDKGSGDGGVGVMTGKAVVDSEVGMGKVQEEEKVKG
jgi:amino acid transporter